MENLFWLFFVGVILLNALLLKERFKPYIQQNPSLEEGYVKIYRGFVYYASLPFIVMGIGTMFGGIKSPSDLFSVPNLQNPYVLAFYATLYLLWFLLVIWIFFMGGADFLEEHRGIFTNATPSATEIKLYMTFGLVGIAIFTAIVFSGLFSNLSFK
jgi:hypothetical protein